MTHRRLPPEHVAYMQVEAVNTIKAHSVVYPIGTANDDGIPRVTSLFNPITSSCCVGVADAPIASGSRGTVVVAGIVTLYGEVFSQNPASDQSMHFGRVIFAADVDENAKKGGGILPIGTLLTTDVPGLVNDMSGKYTHGGKLFLCPWMSAFTVPRKQVEVLGELPPESSIKVHEDSSETAWETFYEPDGTQKQKRSRTEVYKDIRPVPEKDDSGHVDLRQLLGERSVEAMIEQLNEASPNSQDIDDERRKEIEAFLCKLATTGIDTAKEDTEAMRTCFIQ